MAVPIEDPPPFTPAMLTNFQHSTGHPTIMVDCDPTLNPDTHQDAQAWVARIMHRRSLMPPHLRPGIAQYKKWHRLPPDQSQAMLGLNEERVRWWQQYTGPSQNHGTDAYLVAVKETIHWTDAYIVDASPPP